MATGMSSSCRCVSTLSRSFLLQQPYQHTPDLSTAPCGRSCRTTQHLSTMHHCSCSNTTNRLGLDAAACSRCRATYGKNFDSNCSRNRVYQQQSCLHSCRAACVPIGASSAMLRHAMPCCHAVLCCASCSTGTTRRACRSSSSTPPRTPRSLQSSSPSSHRWVGGLDFGGLRCWVGFWVWGDGHAKGQPSLCAVAAAAVAVAMSSSSSGTLP